MESPHSPQKKLGQQPPTGKDIKHLDLENVPTTTAELITMLEDILKEPNIIITALFEKRPFEKLNDEDALYLAQAVMDFKGHRHTETLDPKTARPYLQSIATTGRDQNLLLNQMIGFLKNKKENMAQEKQSEQPEKISFWRRFFERFIRQQTS